MTRIVYLMRGLPACGKSHTARQLAGEHGLVCETDEFFFTQVGDDANRYDYDPSRLEEARRWNFERFANGVERGLSPIVVDRGNGLNQESRQYARFAFVRGYDVKIAEPDSPWWRELRVLLKYRDFVDPRLLDGFARQLAEKSRDVHRVPVETIRDWMSNWKSDLTVSEIMSLNGN